MSQNIGVERFSEFLVKYIKRPGFKKKIIDLKTDISFFTDEPVLFCEKIMDVIKNSKVIKDLVLNEDYYSIYVEYDIHDRFLIKNKADDILLKINLLGLLELILQKDINFSNIIFSVNVGEYTLENKLCIDSLVIFRNKYNNQKSFKDLKTLINHFNFLCSAFGIVETRFLIKLLSISNNTSNLNEFNIIEHIEVGANTFAPSNYLNCSSLEYIYYKFEAYWDKNNIKNINQFEKYISQYKEMKTVIGDVNAKQSLLLDFYAYYQKIYFTLEPYDENVSIVGIKFPFKNNTVDIKDFYDYELVYLFTFKSDNKSGYFVSDLMASGKDLWTHIKMLEY